MSNQNFILVFLVVALVLGGIFYLVYPTPNEYQAPVENNSENDGANNNGPGMNEPVACTMEAKLCPDGSYVGRTGPNCEFAVCPGQ